ncbi:hypothetical protein VPNG_08232 [Cytospora leucostoma]|uniref:HNH domain-containing protein n=1 Tax=Cytospora leucostoma TaxID=1230097 RepID=A0A423W764_9PEZI|nr:hypothetical protein VPNG_08232 [Cytospora leucostoma]
MYPKNEGGHAENYEQFRDALTTTLIDRLSKPQKRVKSRKRTKPSDIRSANTQAHTQGQEDGDPDAENLADFADYITSLTFSSLPPDLQAIGHRDWIERPDLQEKYNVPLTSHDISEHVLPRLDPSITDSLMAYGIIQPPADDITTFLAPVLTSYLAAVTAPPPAACTTREKVTECEICGRDWVPLTYHHLIPRFVHAKAVKRGWHREEDLQNAAWLCRACHSFVHRFAGHEELAREFYSVEKLLEQEEIRKFATWVGRSHESHESQVS